MKNLFQRIATLALAMVWVFGVQASPAVSATTTTSLNTSSTASQKRSSTVRYATRRSPSSHRYRRRAARIGASPWRMASYGDPAVEDNPVGEDPVVRQAALDALGHLSGSIVVVDPNTGRILSIVNQKLALSSGFTPCSTFKPIVALAALREGLITPNTRLYVGSHMRMNVTDALAHSNNSFFLKLGEMLGFQRITEYAQEFGLGEKAALDVPGESPGVYPTAPPTEGGVGFLAYCGTNIEITPLQMAAVISAIANGGRSTPCNIPARRKQSPPSKRWFAGTSRTWPNTSPRSTMDWPGRCSTEPADPPMTLIYRYLARRARAAKTAPAWAGSCPSPGSRIPAMWPLCSCAEAE